jgi:hypothetical protein
LNTLSSIRAFCTSYQSKRNENLIKPVLPNEETNKKSMRLFIFLPILCSLLQPAFAQQLPANSHQSFSAVDLRLGQAYLKKSRSHKIVAFSLLGAGAISTITGIGLASNGYFGDYYNYDYASLAAGVGLSLMATSIPFFIIGAKNKGRAEVLLHDEKIFGYGAALPVHIRGIGIAVSINSR